MEKQKPTKYYSMRQEQMIADYLGWSAVSASGARPFNPGDIKSSAWLAECKTHTSEIDNITIDKSVWSKISNEATGSMKSPVLFVDNGTQTIEGTWAIFPKRLYFGTKLTKLSLPYNESSKKITFKHSIFYKEFSKNRAYMQISVQNESLYIIELKIFRELFCKAGE